MEQRPKFPFNMTGLSNPPINKIENYEYGRCIKAYLRQKLNSCGKSNKELMEASGYTNPGKFQFHQAGWHGLCRNIPMKYLEAIDVDLEVLQYVVELDNENFQKAIKLPRFPTSYIRRLMPAMYQNEDFKPGTLERDAIELLKEFAQNDKHSYCINYPGLLTITIWPPDKVIISHRIPTLNIVNKHWISFGSDGSAIGTTRLGK